MPSLSAKSTRAWRARTILLAGLALCCAGIAGAWGGESAPAPRRLMVKMRAGTERDGLSSALRRAGAAAGSRSSWRSRATRWQVVTVAPGQDAGWLMGRLAADPAVEAVEPEKFARAQATQPDDLLPAQWALDNRGQSVDGGSCVEDADIDAPEAWDLSRGDLSITVAVLDTGVHADHPDLAENLLGGHDFVNDDDNPWDDAGPGHGTPVAGIIGAVGNNGIGMTGINWNVSLLPVKVCDGRGSCPYSAIVAGLEYATSRGARVINMSLACDEHLDPWTGTCDAQRAGECWSGMLYDALDAARAAGALVVVSAGNCGADLDGEAKAYPCAYDLDNVLCVGATDARDELAWFSNYGARHVKVAAPGSKVLSLSTQPSSELLWSGTSFSAPMAAGVAALTLARNNTFTATALARRVTEVPGMASLSGLIRGAARLDAVESIQDLLLSPRVVSHATAAAISLAGDFDGDGRMDLCEGGPGPGLRVAVSDGAVLGAFSEWSDRPARAAQVAGDFDGDGRDDIARRADDGITVMLSTGAAFTPPRRWTPAGWRGAPAVGDVDGDGRDDLVRTAGGRGYWVSLSTGMGFAAPARWSLSAPGTASLLADVNGDGRADLVRLVAGRVEVSLSTGSSFAAPTTWATGAGGALKAADMNGDGLADLVSRDEEDGCWDVMLSDGTRLAAARPWACGPADQGWSLGDFNGDGRADLLRRRAGAGWEALLSTR